MSDLSSTPVPALAPSYDPNDYFGLIVQCYTFFNESTGNGAYYNSSFNNGSYYLATEYGDQDWCRPQVFCEDIFWYGASYGIPRSGLPEYASVFSAYMMCAMAIYQLSWDHPVEIIRFLSACIFVNGICSSINHWTGCLIFSYLDNATMYIPSYIIVATVFSKFLLTLYCNPSGAPCSVPCCLCDITCQMRRKYCCRAFFRIFTWVFVCFFLILNFFNDWMLVPSGDLFVASFAMPLLMLAGMGCATQGSTTSSKLIAQRHYGHKDLLLKKKEDNDGQVHGATRSNESNDALLNDHDPTHNQPILDLKTSLGITVAADDTIKKKRRIPIKLHIMDIIAQGYFCRGIIFCAFCGTLWLTTEIFCPTYPQLSYIFGHTWWHLGMSYGLSLILMYFAYLECVFRGHETFFSDSIMTNSWWCQKIACNCGIFCCKEGACYNDPIKQRDQIKREIFHQIDGELNQILKEMNVRFKTNELDANNSGDRLATAMDPVELTIEEAKAIANKLRAKSYWFPLIHIKDPTLQYAIDVSSAFDTAKVVVVELITESRNTNDWD